MSLVPYKEGSVILDDPSSKSLVIVHPSSGALEFFQQIHYGDGDSNTQRIKSDRKPIASFICPQCGTNINPYTDPEDVPDKMRGAERTEDDRSSNQRFGSRINLSKSYFQLLERNHRHYTLQGSSAKALPRQQASLIPENLFIPGYFQKFFKTITLLGSGARGSVYKVVHMIGDIDLGVFALKKIPIGNDMIWFQKCIREVKALSSLTHKSANLITYNHVWLEMNTACGLVRTIDGKGCDQVEEIPCIFILQQYCSGGNLEDFIFRDVFQKFQDHQSSDERKKKFLYRRSHPNVSLGLSTLQIASMIRDIARGLQELHDIGLIHRDLKPSNCLLLESNTEQFSMQDYVPTIVIGDLGECQLNGESRTASGATGTLEYTAPEIVITGIGRSRPTDYNEFTFASDMYSLGMILYFVIFGELPFKPQLEMVDLKQKIKTFTLDEEQLITKHRESGLTPINAELFALMQELLSRNVVERPSAAEVVVFLDRLLSNLFADDVLASATNLSEDLDILDEPQDTVENAGGLIPKVQQTASLENELLVLKKNDIVSDRIPDAKLYLKKWIYRFCCLFLTVCTLSISDSTMCWSIYLALILFGMSVNARFSAQKWMAVSLGFIALVTFISGHRS
ncbi:hypothetical protein HG535_0C04900 [Zygotorulaspora mrakii]|uniref:Protein kinase domain-containing protein n=1 Tax=Zygotorulaspora mrakii TaxID=42260 RepID=A0A7H9B141_ZYGMR|nr:uncharacterized protein HG535_0C04900 [Zygotorulaspora mrakii]QLG72136.1 hypothetical protein HG535_0C04900 [Zygotorulaspora mrakii]